jgi:DNA repair protein RadC
VYVRELTVGYRLRRIRRPVWPDGRLHTPQATAAVLISILRHEPIEVCGILCLSTRLDLLAYHELSRGTLDSTVVHPRDVFRTALLANAASVVVAHNHPTGDPTPSPDDMVLTARLKAAGELLGVPLTDHVIVGSGRYYSFQEAGLL